MKTQKLFFLLFLIVLPMQVFAEKSLTVVHPNESQKLPAIKEVFVFGEVTPGSSLTINGAPIKVHPKGGYLTMLPVSSGPVKLNVQATTPAGKKITLDRHFTIADALTESPVSPLTIQQDRTEPAQDLLLSPGDEVRVSLQGSPQATVEFSIAGVAQHIPMAEINSAAIKGVYSGSYIIQPNDKAKQASITFAMKHQGKTVNAKAKGLLTIEKSAIPRTGLIIDDIAPVRTAADGGHDMYLYKGMRVQLTGKMNDHHRVRLSSSQSGWVKSSSVQELRMGTVAPRSVLGNIEITHRDDSTLIKVPLTDVLPYRTEQTLDPMQVVVTLYGAINKTDLIQYDPNDTLIRQISWKQLNNDTCQLIINPKFKKWSGFDVRYEGTTLIIEVRKPVQHKTSKGMTIALDPGHGGPLFGSTGPHGTLEKDVNLTIARVVKRELESAGAHVVM
ncbi:MAG: N-acetylmuramoyl-L-alanine amidase, partial [Pseudomonadota bacterium]|nr:N-acetylmuramoyl-L-alanine amidase [Pseudomonadota bacterium]